MITVTEGASTAVKSVSALGGNVGTAAKSAVEGAIEGARELGLDAVTGVIGGVKVILTEPFKASATAEKAQR